MEQAFLGSLLLDGSGIRRVVGRVTLDDLWLEKHREIYDAMLSLDERGLSIDFMTVNAELERRNKLAFVGGTYYLTSLLNSVPTAAHIGDYAQVITDTAFDRRLVQISTDIAELAYTGNLTADEKHTLAAKEIMRLRGTGNAALVEMRDVMQGVAEKLRSRMLNPVAITGLQTGYTDIDSLLGGLQVGLHIVAGRPSMGKTAWALSLLYSVASLGKRVCLVSLEMTKEQLITRLISYCSGVNSLNLERGGLIVGNELYLFTADEQRIINEAIDYVNSLPIVFNAAPDLTTLKLKSALTDLLLDEEIELLIWDYLQLTNEPGDNRNLQVGAASRNLKLLSDELGIPTIAVCQLSRAVEGRADKRPGMADLRDSGEIEQNADTVGFPYREDYYNAQVNPSYKKNDRMEIALAKDRLTGKAPHVIDGLYLHPVTGRVVQEKTW